MSVEQIEAIAKAISGNNGNTNIGKNNTYVSIGVVIVIVVASIWIVSSQGELKSLITNAISMFEIHKDSPQLHNNLRIYTDNNFVSNDRMNTVEDDIEELKDDVKDVKTDVGKILIEVRSQRIRREKAELSGTP